MQVVKPIQFHRSDSHCHRWGLILAGGDGKRLLPLTRRITGDDRPKQFCAIVGDETLLQQLDAEFRDWFRGGGPY